MPVFTEPTLKKMETFWVRRRKEWGDRPLSSWQLWWDPSLSLRPNEDYGRKLYLRVALRGTLRTLTFLTVANGIGFALGTLVVCPEFWPLVHNPKNHAAVIGALSQEGFYLLPLVPLFCLFVNAVGEWPEYFFWNRRAKRLQTAGPAGTSTASVAQAFESSDSVWPPPPRRRG